MNKTLNFVGTNLRKPLTVSEVNYWKRNLARILKIGAEFEFNLPEKQTGTCKGRSFTCICEDYGKEDKTCWTECLREDLCKTVPDTTKCSNFSKKNKCSNDKCIKCKDYKFQCLYNKCSNFVTKCTTCNDFTVDCKECQFMFDPAKNPDHIRQACTEKFAPSGSYGVVSKSGVHQVVTDGSLLGKKGMEVITTGRRVDYWEFYRMSKDIIDTSVEKGAYINERCSIHMHILSSYYDNLRHDGPPSKRISELERSIPEIILANLHQLVRRYQNAITWMTTGLDTMDNLTRWEKFRVATLNVSAILNEMSSVNEQVIHNSGGNKYGWINYKFCQFDDNGDISRLHTEIRVMDGLLSPSAISAVACLYYALFIKAVELSRYGVMEVGEENWLEKATEVKNALMNNCASWEEGNKHGRFSDTKNIEKYIDILQSESFEMISQVKHIVSSVGPAYDILEKLADSPCSIRRCNGDSWEKIEKDLQVELTEEGIFEYEVRKIIDTRLISNVSDISKWITEVSKTLKENKNLEMTHDQIKDVEKRVYEHLYEKQTVGEMIWAEKIGSMIII